MLGWALGFFVAAILAAMFGFGVVASTFAGVAMILFWVFVGLTVVSLILSVFGGRSVVAADGHVSHSGGGGFGFGALAIATILGILAYAWIQNDWSAEKTGRAIDQGAAEITADAGEALQGAGDRAETLVERTGDQLQQDTAEGLDQAQETVDPNDEANTEAER